MPLRVELKPFERIVIGETVIINSGTALLRRGVAASRSLVIAMPA